MFEFVRYPENKPEQSGYYYTFCRYPDTPIHGHLYKAHFWNNENQDWVWRNPVIVLGFIPESRQDFYIPCVYWSADNKIKPFPQE